MESPAAAVTLPARSEVAVGDTWDLTVLFLTDADWEKAFKVWQKRGKQYPSFKGTLGKSAATLRAYLEFDRDVDLMSDRLAQYAFLKTSEDSADSAAQRMKGRFVAASTEIGELASFVRPELLAIPAKKMDAMLKHRDLADWRLVLERVLRYRAHTLTDNEEKLLTMAGQAADASSVTFRQLIDADMKWGMIKDAKGREVELSHSTFSLLLESPDRGVRENAFRQFYKQYDGHRNTIAAAYNGSVQRDVFYAKARGFDSARESALFNDNVPVAVYDNLIKAVRKHLPTVHRFYDVRREAMKLKDLHHYDCYVPILSDLKIKHDWAAASNLVVDALAPLGAAYQNILRHGLSEGRWCDRYPNKGKSSGAFSSGSYDGLPYILMNFQPTVLDHVFTLAHEAGHSMHSHLSSTNQPYQYHNYTIFVAEVASTFNEQLLGRYMIDRTDDKRMRALLVNKQIDEIRGTIVRQTMFAEFEKLSHELVERGEPLTVDAMKSIYRGLLEAYFGPRFTIDAELEIECMRIPHFYRAFYVYKYATGLSAAIALSRKVLKGGPKELDQYLGFLSAGCSKWPIDLLKDAGVDMSKPAPVEAAMKHMATLVDELETLL